MWKLAVNSNVSVFSVEALRAAVASHESIETIQELFEGGRVPKDVRAEFWKVKKIPNTLYSVYICLSLCMKRVRVVMEPLIIIF